MRVSSKQFYAVVCGMVTKMMQQSESAAYSDLQLVKRAIKVAKMIADEIPDDEECATDDFKLDDNQIYEAVSQLFDDAKSREIKSLQMIMALKKLVKCKHNTAIAYLQRAEQLGIISSRVENNTTIYKENFMTTRNA